MLTWVVTALTGEVQKSPQTKYSGVQTNSHFHMNEDDSGNPIFVLNLGLGLGVQTSIESVKKAMPYLVRDRLFFGDISDAAEVLQVGNCSGRGGDGGGGITHVLSVLSSVSISYFSEWRPSVSISAEEIRKVFAGAGESPKRSLVPGKLFYSLESVGPEKKLVRMAVPLRDTEDENLLDYLDVCLDFIDQGRKEGAVLVHCFAGVSRSASIITAYLMRTEQKSLEDALESLREVCEFICPNDGFLDQLKMFEEMGFKVETSSPMYKRFRLKILGQSYKLGEKIDRSIFEADPGSSPESSFCADISKGDQRRSAYRCKKCRRIVALQENVVSHVPGEGETCFEWQKRKSGNPLNRFQEQGCSSLFLEPLKWMASVEEGALEGKLPCIHCDARLGYFNWSGIQCNCGSWITPAFQIHKSKVDISTI